MDLPINISGKLLLWSNKLLLFSLKNRVLFLKELKKNHIIVQFLIWRFIIKGCILTISINIKFKKKLFIKKNDVPYYLVGDYLSFNGFSN